MLATILYLLTTVTLISHHDELFTPAGCNPHLTLVLVSDAIRPTDGGAHLWGRQPALHCRDACCGNSKHASFYGDRLLGPRPASKLQDHPLSVVPNYLFTTFVATLWIQKPYRRPVTPGRGMPWRYGTLLVPRLRMHGALHPLLHTSSWHSDWLNTEDRCRKPHAT
jgi:hypothetical protein